MILENLDHFILFVCTQFVNIYRKSRITCEFFEARNGCAKKCSMLMQKDILIHEKVFLNRAFWVQFNFLLYSLEFGGNRNEWLCEI